MIGILDSGMGGLTTLAALAKEGCDSAFCYYADTANAPYGNKNKTEVKEAVGRAAEALVGRGAERIVVACNTASLVALKQVRCTINVPIYGVTPPVEEALKRGGYTLLLGTALTCRNYKNRAGFLSLAMPELATIIDRDYPDTVGAEAYCRQRLKDVGAVDNLMLGCTHYVLIEDILRRLTEAKRVWNGYEELAKRMEKTDASASELAIDFIGSGEIDIARYKEVARLLCSRR